MAAKKTAQPKEYFIVNPHGTIHGCTREHAADRLKQPGWRLATKTEVDAYKANKLQVFDEPLANPFKPEITDEPIPEPAE